MIFVRYHHKFANNVIELFIMSNFNAELSPLILIPTCIFLNIKQNFVMEIDCAQCTDIPKLSHKRNDNDVYFLENTYFKNKTIK